jgi:hypothetical protein
VDQVAGILDALAALPADLGHPRRVDRLGEHDVGPRRHLLALELGD